MSARYWMAADSSGLTHVASVLRTAWVSAGLSMTSGSSSWRNSRAVFRVNPRLADVAKLVAAAPSEVECGYAIVCGDETDDRKHLALDAQDLEPGVSKCGLS